MNERPKRILIFSLVYYPRFICGAEVAVKEITDRISQRDFEFDMITLRLDSRLPKFERTGNINVHRVGWALKQREPSDSLPWHLHLNKYAMLWTAFTKALSLNRIRKYDAIWSISRYGCTGKPGQISTATAAGINGFTVSGLLETK